MSAAVETSFESAYGELEAVVSELEEGAPTLADAMALYERGVALARDCAALLDQAELRVQQLIEQEDGTLHEAPLGS